MITGIYSTNVDDKGRILLPSRMRQALQSQELVVLPGLDENHLMLMTPSYFGMLQEESTYHRTLGINIPF